MRWRKFVAFLARDPWRGQRISQRNQQTGPVVDNARKYMNRRREGLARWSKASWAGYSRAV